MGWPVGRRVSLICLQQSRDVLVEDLCFRSADVFGLNVTIAINQKCDGQAQNSAIQLSGLRIAYHNGVIHMKLLVKRADWIGGVVHGNANDLQTLSTIFLL